MSNNFHPSGSRCADCGRTLVDEELWTATWKGAILCPQDFQARCQAQCHDRGYHKGTSIKIYPATMTVMLKCLCGEFRRFHYFHQQKSESAEIPPGMRPIRIPETWNDAIGCMSDQEMWVRDTAMHQEALAR